MSTRVMKFGGTSVADGEAIARAARIASRSTTPRRPAVVVVSAMSGVTDAMTRGILCAAEGDIEESKSVSTRTKERTQEAAEALVPSLEERKRVLDGADEVLARYRAVCDSVAVLGEATSRSIDRAISCGEPLVAALMAARLRAIGCPATAVDPRELIITDDQFQDAAPLLEETKARAGERLAPLLERGDTPVVGGFIGATTTGVTTTLGRGGSDFSAAILGHALDADEVVIWTDVDGVMTADPRLVGDARVIPTLSYAEVGELAYFGAKVLHPRTIRPLIDRRVPLRICNSFRPEQPGTTICHESRPAPGGVKAVTEICGLTMVIVEGRGMLGVPGIAARTFAAVARCRANVLMISQSSSEQSICFVIPSKDVACVQAGIEEEFARELERRQIDRVRALDDVSVVTALGSGIRGAAGVAGRLFSALARDEVNIIAIAQGSSEYAISLVVSSADRQTAVRSIHGEVIL